MIRVVGHAQHNALCDHFVISDGYRLSGLDRTEKIFVVLM